MFFSKVFHFLSISCVHFFSDKPESVTFTSSTSDPMNESPVTLTCTSNGIPAPSYKFESIIGSNTQTVQDTTSGTYSIARINYADYVNYSVSFRCMAYNTIGSASSKVANLNIKGNLKTFTFRQRLAKFPVIDVA